MEDVFGFGLENYPLLEYNKDLNLMKAAIEVSDFVTTVSPTYSCEILNPWFSHGLDAMLNAKRYKLHGILNGIDTAEYNPETDKRIYKNFSVSDLKGKAVNKTELLKEVGLPEKKDEPLVGVVTRLVAHKGLDLIKFVLDDICQSGMQLVILGSGDYEYESYFQDMKHKYPDNLAVIIGFIPQLARRVYAGADLFLMPSKSEPCGLAQMVSLRYGTVPIVRETGGLYDSIKDFGDPYGNGYTFKSYNAHDMLGALLRAKGAYLDKKGWEEKVKTAMDSDFSWAKSAGEYIKLYNKLL
jgi:starch synthase